MIVDRLPPAIQTPADVGAVALAVLAFLETFNGIIGALAATVSLVYLLVRLWETKTVQALFKRGKS